MADSFSFHEFFTSLEMTAFFFFVLIEELFTLFLTRHSNWSIELISGTPVPSFDWIRHVILVGPSMVFMLSFIVFSFRPVFSVSGLFGFNGIVRDEGSVIDHGPFRRDLRLLNHGIFWIDYHFRFWLMLFLKGMEIFWDKRWFMTWERLLSEGSEGQSSKR